MKTMTYDGFTAQVVYSKEDRLFVGDVLDIGNDVVCFYGNSDEELKEAFEDVVNLYVESKENKRPPIHKYFMGCLVSRVRRVLQL